MTTTDDQVADLIDACKATESSVRDSITLVMRDIQKQLGTSDNRYDRWRLCQALMNLQDAREALENADRWMSFTLGEMKNEEWYASRSDYGQKPVPRDPFEGLNIAKVVEEGVVEYVS